MEKAEGCPGKQRHVERHDQGFFSSQKELCHDQIAAVCNHGRCRIQYPNSIQLLDKGIVENQGTAEDYQPYWDDNRPAHLHVEIENGVNGYHDRVEINDERRGWSRNILQCP